MVCGPDAGNQRYLNCKPREGLTAENAIYDTREAYSQKAMVIRMGAVEKAAEKGLVGLSKCFRGAVSGYKGGGKLLFVGSPFTCLPFAEFLSYAIRDLNMKTYFMPGLDADKIREIMPVDGYGFQLGKAEDRGDFDVVVLLGGLALPKTYVDPTSLRKALLRVSKLDYVVALFFQGVMRKEEWLNEFKFRFIVDADISKVVLEELD